MRMTMIIPLTAMHHGDAVMLRTKLKQEGQRNDGHERSESLKREEALDLEKIRWPCLHPQTFLRPLATRLIAKKKAIMRRKSLSVLCLMNPLCSQLSFERH